MSFGIRDPKNPLWEEEELHGQKTIGTFYSRPGQVTNAGLLSGGVTIENLVEFFDFVCVPEAVWRYFEEWYGTDVEVPGVLRKTTLQNELIFS